VEAGYLILNAVEQGEGIVLIRMNLTKIRRAVEELESEMKEREANREWQKVMQELKIENLSFEK